MALTLEQQAVGHISRAKHILVTTREHPTMDSLCSVAALAVILKNLNKSFDAVVPGFDPDKAPSFLPNGLNIKNRAGAMRAFHLTLDVREVPLGELMYDVKDGKLDITVVPKEGEWSPKDLSFRHGDDRYDLVITVDVPDFASLGEAFRHQADFFYRTTIINIDHASTNEYWGQINLVDLNAVSTSEVVYQFLKTWNGDMITPDAASLMLAGMIANTRSFRTPNVTPRTLQASSDLIERGAKRGEIVSALWRTRTIPVLKLWGRALARLEHDRDSGLVWTSLADGDFMEAGAQRDDVKGVVDELLAYAPDAKVVAILMQDRDGLRVNLFATAPLSAAELARPFGGNGTREQATFSFHEGANATEAAQKFLERLRLTLNANRA